MSLRHLVANHARRAAVAVWVVVLFVFAAQRTSAAALTWSATPANNLWSTPANWGGTAPASASDTLTFAASSVINLTHDIPGLVLGGLTFNSTAPAYTLSLGQPLTLVSGGSITLNTGSSAVRTLAGAGPLRIGVGPSPVSLINNSSGAFSLGSLVVAASADGGTLTLGGSGGGTVSGQISDGPGSLALEKIGAGSWTLQGAHTHSGGTTVSGGTLQLLGTLGSPLVVSSGATATLGANAAATGVVANGNLTFTGSPAATVETLSGSGQSGVVTVATTAPVALTLAPGVQSFNRFTFSGGGTQALTLNGTGATTTLTSLGQTGTANAGWTVTLDGGAWSTTNFASNSGSPYGTYVLNGGAGFRVGGGRFGLHGRWLIPNGSLAWPSGYSAEGAAGAGYQTTVSGTGSVTWESNLTLVATAATAPVHNFIEVQGGSATVRGNLTLGDTQVHTAETNRLALSGGKLLVTGTLAGGTPTAGQTNLVQLSGGTLVVGTFNASRLGGAVVNEGATLAPGDVGAAGRLTVTGGLTLSSGTLAVELLGRTAATTAFATTPGYDNLAVSGAVTLGGALAVYVPRPFIPTAGDTFTFLTGGSVPTGSFQNTAVDGSTRLSTADGNGSFRVRLQGTAVVLTDYLDNTLPVITAAPEADQVQIGQAFALSAGASTPVAGALTFQWFRNGVAVPGATASTYTVASATAAHDGLYHLVATNSSGSVTSASAYLHVISPVLLHYKMDQPPAAGAGAVLDETGNTAATVVGTPLPVLQTGASANTGSSYDFSQTGSYLTIDSAKGGLRNFGNLKNATGMTIAFWYKPDVPVTGYYTNGNIARFGSHFWIDWAIDPHGTAPQFNFGDDITAPNFLAAPNTRGGLVSDGQWHFYAITLDYRNPLGPTGAFANNVIPYADGQVSGGYPVAGSQVFRFLQSFMPQPGEVLSLGASNGRKQNWDNFMIFNYPLTQAEITQLYTTGSLTAHAPQPTARASVASLILPDQQVTLTGEVFNFGQSLPVTTAWSVVSAPAGGSVTFAQPAAVSTTATFSPVAGTYILALTADNTAFSRKAHVKVEVFASLPLTAYASVGGRPEATVLTGATVSLDGASRLFTTPNPAGVTYLWSLLSGPAAPVFSSATQPSPTVTFPTPGTYVLQLAVTSGANTSTTSVTVRVQAEHLSQVVGRAAPQLLLWPANTTQLTATVTQTNPARPVSYNWTQVSGPGVTTFATPSAANTGATFSAPGVYELRVEAAAGAAGTARSSVWLQIFPPGPGNEAAILPPQPRQYAPQPEPYVHPRFLFTEADRADLTWRSQNVPRAVAALGRMSANINATLYHPTHTLGLAYRKMRDGATDFSIQPLDRGEYYTALAQASYIAWLAQDQIRLRELGTVLANSLRDELIWNVRDNSQVRTVGIIYDLTFNQMSEDQRVDCRAYLGPLTARAPVGFQYLSPAYGASMAIYGETGYDEAATRQTFTKLKGAFFDNTYATAQGWKQEDSAYGGFMGWSTNTAVQMYRQLEPLIVTGNVARENYMELYQLFADTTATTGGGMGGHSEAGWAQSGQQYLMHKYFYPEDPLDDFVRNANTLAGKSGDDLYEALFALPPLTPRPTFASVAAARNFPLAKFDSQRGIGIARSDWSEDATHFDLDVRRWWGGHIHASVNELTLFSVRRNWFINPGYGSFPNELHSTLLIDGVGSGRNPGRLVDVVDRPPLTAFVGDARHAYTYAGTQPEGDLNGGVSTGSIWRDLLFPGSSDGVFPPAPDFNASWTNNLVRVRGVNGIPTALNPVQRAFRTASLVRGASPYVLVLDDLQKDDAPHDYTWIATLPDTVALRPGATDTEAVLYHTGDAANPQAPQLLVRVLSAEGTASPITVGTSTFNGQTAYRLQIPRRAVAPNYRILIFPHKLGDPLPVTAWADNVLTVSLPGQPTDRFTFSPTPEGRTRVVAFTRTMAGRTAPTLTTPASLAAIADPVTPVPDSGQPGATLTFNVTASGDTGASLTPTVQSPSGTTFPVGESLVYASATDALGQIAWKTFPVLIAPAAPRVTVTSAGNFANTSASIALRWSAIARATAYSVKRSTSPVGPFTTVSDRQVGITFAESGLTPGAYFYVVTTWFNELEGPPSPVIAAAPELAPFAAYRLGTATTSAGVHLAGDALIVADVSGSFGGGADSGVFAGMPWTGDGTFVARLQDLLSSSGSLTPYAGYGLMLRASSAANALQATATYNTFFAPNLNLRTRATTGTGNVATALGGDNDRPVWLRLQRTGNQVAAAYSSDGTTWQNSSTSVIVNFPDQTLIGVYAGGANGSALHAARYDRLVFLGTPVPAVQPSALLVTWQASPGLTFTLRRALSAGGPFTTVASGLTSPSWTDPDVAPGQAYFYRVSTQAAEGGGATTSAVGSCLFPFPAVAPAGLAITADLGSITLTWNAGPANTAPTYSVQRGTSAGGPFTTVASGLSGTSYVDTGFANDGTYFYRVVADNGRNTATSATATTSPLAGVFTKADNATALDQAASWSPTARPGVGDTLRWTGTYGTTSAVASLGNGLNVAEVELVSPSRAIVIGAGTGPLTVGAGGFDLSAATQNLTIDAPVALSSNQTWTVATGRILTLGAPLTSPAGRVLTLAGAGTLNVGPTTGSTTATLGLGDFSMSAATLRDNRTDAHTLLGGVFSASSGTLQLGTATTDLTLNSTNLPAGSTNTLTLTGTAGSRLTLDAAPSANVSVGGTFSGVHLRVRQGNIALSNAAPAGNLTIENGTVTTTATDRFQLSTASQALTVTGGTLDARAGTTFGLRVGSGNGATGTGAQTVTASQTGGTVLAASLSVGGNDASVTKSPSYNLSGGLLAVTGNLGLGADAALTGSATFTLDGGKLVVPGTLSGAQSGARQIFTVNGGTLVVGTLTATNLRTADLAANGLFTQSGGVLAPGDLGTAGRTVITGNYALGTAGALSVDVGGTIQATAFQTGGYDYLNVSGTTTLAGRLTVRLANGFTPANATSFTVLNSTGALTGAFANAAFGTRIVTEDLRGSFLVSQTGNTVVLGGYLAHTAREGWRLRHFGSTGTTGSAADTADFDGDGVSNLLEYALDTDPSSAASVSVPTPQVSGLRLQVSFLRARSDVTYHIEVSSDLSANSWTLLATNPGTVGQSVTVSDTVDLPSATPPRRFLRLRVTPSL